MTAEYTDPTLDSTDDRPRFSREERQRAGAQIEDVGERVRREVQLGICWSEATRAVAELRPLVQSGILKADIAAAKIRFWIEESGEPRSRGSELAAWLICHLAGAGEAEPPARSWARPVIKVAPGGLSMPGPRPATADTGAEADRITLAAEARRIANEAGSLAELVDQTEDALIEARLGLYQRGGAVVRAAPVIDRTPGGGEREIIRVVDVSDTYLAELMGSAAQFERFNERAKRDLPTACPPVLAKSYLARRGIGWQLPELRGVIHAPTLRRDGGILDVPGFDYRTGLYYDPRGEPVPDVPQRPSRDDAARALVMLTSDLLEEFPFVDEQDTSVALAAILTAVVRRSLPAAPLFAFTAPTPGTGKSYLIDVASMIAFGEPAAGFTWSDDDAENRKQLDAALLKGANAIMLDNVTAPVGGDRLNQIMTQPRATVRVLGESRTVDVPCGAFVTANGNNLVIAADMTRRTLLCRLDAGLERPELRSFKHDPVRAVRDDRAGYIAAALTVLRAYHVAGRPEKPAPLGSFDEWSSWVRGALLWLDCADPVDSMETVRADDPKRNELLAIAEQWDAVIGGKRVTAAQLILAATATTGAADFREALLAVAGAGGAINTRRLGKWLGANHDKPVAGMKIVAGGYREGARLWALEGGRVAGAAGDNVVALRPAPEFAAEPTLEEMLR